MLSGAQTTVGLTDAAVERAQASKRIGFRPYEALHLACAEHAAVDVCLTTDDRVRRMAARRAAQLPVGVAHPVAWLLEVIEP